MVNDRPENPAATLPQTSDNGADNANSTHPPAGVDRAENTTATHGLTGTTAADLSRQVFANPEAFLKIVQSDFSKIAGAGSKEITKDDLVKYETTGTDADGRAAARIAANHFDDLSKMSQGLPLSGDLLLGVQKTKPVLTASGLDIDMDIYKGTTGWDLTKKELMMSPVTIAIGAVTALGALATVANLEDPPVAAIVGTVTAGMGGLTGALAARMIKAPGQMSAIVRADQQKLASWSEINGKATS